MAAERCFGWQLRSEFATTVKSVWNEVVINGRFVGQQATGMQRFANEIVLALDRLVEQFGFEVELQLPPNANLISGLRKIRQRVVGRHTGHIWEQVELPRHAGGRLLLNLISSAPVCYPGRQILVVHDAAVFDNPENFQFRYRLAYRAEWMLHQFLPITVCTVSQFSSGRLAHFGLAASAPVIPNGCDHMDRITSDQTIFERLPAIRRGAYILAVGNKSPNKNFKVVADALRLCPEMQFVVCGSHQNEIFANSNAVAGENVVKAGFVRDDELKALYEDAYAFVFPSLYEGFGIPPMEAMRVGCPTIVAHNSAIPETCGDASLYFNSYSPGALTAEITRLRSSPVLRSELIARGLARSRQFEWHRSAEILFGIIKSVQGRR